MVDIPRSGEITQAGTEGRKPRLLEQVRRRLRAKHYSLRTEQAYVFWIRRFIIASGKRHPRLMGAPEVEVRQVHPYLMRRDTHLDTR